MECHESIERCSNHSGFLLKHGINLICKCSMFSLMLLSIFSFLGFGRTLQGKQTKTWRRQINDDNFCIVVPVVVALFLDVTFRVVFEVVLSSEIRRKLIKWCFITDFTPNLSTFLQFLATTNDTNHWTMFSYKWLRSWNLRESTPKAKNTKPLD